MNKKVRRGQKQKTGSARGKGGQRKPKSLVLIACEGRKTEPLYLTDIVNDKKLHKRFNIEIIPGNVCGTHPKNIVQFAKEKNGEVKNNGLEYISIWCVFDRNQHEKIEGAFVQARDNDFNVAFSNPCFELWYLLHFQDQRKTIECRPLTRKLRKHISDFDKGASGIYGLLLKNQNDAKKRAKDIRKWHRELKRSDRENPSTNVDELVVYLNKLSKEIT